MRSIKKHNWIAMGLCGIFLSVTLLPRPTQATNGPEDRPIRLYSTAFAEPIGRISYDNLKHGSLMINGRAASTEQPIWSGDLLQAGPGERVSVSMDLIGTLWLSRGAMVRLASRRSTQNDGSKTQTLIASLAQGDIAVSLEHSANAYVRAAGVEYASTEGAAFLASVRAGHASIVVKSGEVREEQAAQHQYTIRPVGHDSKIKVDAGDLTRIQVQVLEDDKPVPGVGVLFALDTSGAVVGLLGMGTLTGTTANVITDAEGMAAVHFVARDSAGTSPISATVEGTRTAWTGEIKVIDDHGTRGGIWAIVVIVAGAAAAGIGWAVTRGDSDPLEAQPPVVKNP